MAKYIRLAKYMLVALLVLLVVVLFSLWHKAAKEARQTHAAYQAVQQEAKATRDAYGRQTLHVEAIQLERKQFAQLAVAKEDSLMRRLQQIVKENKGTTHAAVVVNETTGRLAAASRPVAVDSLQSITYHAMLRDAFTEATVTAGPDSVVLHYRYIKQLEVWHTFRNPLLGRARVTTHIRDTNPNAATTQAVAYVAPGPRQRRGIWAAIGAGIAIAVVVAAK